MCQMPAFETENMLKWKKETLAAILDFKMAAIECKKDYIFGSESPTVAIFVSNVSFQCQEARKMLLSIIWSIR